MNFIFAVILILLETSGCLSQTCEVHKNTIFQLRGTDCGGKCEDLKKPKDCKQTDWVIGCFCKPGYQRNHLWECVPEYECYRPPEKALFRKCGKHAIFYQCGSICKNSCEGFIGRTCNKNSCDDGCFCDKGFLRNEKGKCVHPSKCKKSHLPKRCGVNAIKIECGNSCRNTCEGLIKQNCPEHSCDNGCFCDKGFFRNKKGVCVSQSECLNDFKVQGIENFKAKDSCGKNSVYARCGNLCKNQCTGLVKKNCPVKSCDDGCFCEPGHWRNKQGECVTPDLCKYDLEEKPKSCGKNSIMVKCGNMCKNQCTSLIERNCTENSCDDGCFCDKGLWRNEVGECVKEEECRYDSMPDPQSCGKDQTLSRCGNLCKNSCEGLIKRNCPELSCDTGCLCEKGFWKNRKGECVSKEGCEKDYGIIKVTKKGKKCGKHAVFAKCGNLCKNGCKSLRAKGRCAQKRCDDGCFCVSGFWRNENGICVTKKECKATMLKDRLKLRINTTEPEDAEEQEDTASTTEGSLSSTQGSNHTEKAGAEKTTESDTESNGHESPESTDSPHSTELTTGLTSEKPNNTTTEGTTGGTAVTSTGITTTGPTNQSSNTSPTEPSTESTEPTIKCKINEHYSKCGSSCGESCHLQNATTDKSCPPECNPGCFCDEGLLRNDKGICVPPEQCICKLPEQKCANNKEDFFWCYNECGRTCADLSGKSEKKKCPNKCSRGCLCKEGYIRDDSGVCVEPEKCGKSKMKCGTNEIHSKCGSDCGKGCDDQLKNVTKAECKNCTVGCFCAEGYLRSQHGLCVKQDDCEFKRKGISKTKAECKTDEEYTECGDFCSENCDTSHESPEHCPYTCMKGCHCRKGYKRNEEGVCVDESKCNERPKCKANEEFNDCGSDCGYRCMDLSKANVQCPLSCEKGCFCASGYFRERNNTCVPKDHCVVDPMECPDKEQYKKCGTHCGESCEDLRDPVDCPKECDEGCFCHSGLYRDLEGVCVNKTECDLAPTQTSVPDCPSHEKYKECGNKCDESCEDRVGCKADCQPGCFCEEGHLRHKSGKCVAEDQCKALEQCVECEQNEYYTDCGSDCGNFCSDLGTDIKCPESCRKGCFCKYGFHRNKLGKCVTKEVCRRHLKNFSKHGKPNGTTATVSQNPKFQVHTEFTSWTEVYTVGHGINSSGTTTKP